MESRTHDDKCTTEWVLLDSRTRRKLKARCKDDIDRYAGKDWMRKT